MRPAHRLGGFAWFWCGLGETQFSGGSDDEAHGERRSGR